MACPRFHQAVQFREVRTGGQGTAGNKGGGGRAPVKHSFRSHTVFPCDNFFFQSHMNKNGEDLYQEARPS